MVVFYRFLECKKINAAIYFMLIIYLIYKKQRLKIVVAIIFLKIMCFCINHISELLPSTLGHIVAKQTCLK
jgi:hypothetical protein